MATATATESKSAVRDIELWVFRVVWLVLPFTAFPLLTRALEQGGRGLEVGGTIVLWVIWAGLLIATMVPRTETLTAVRIIAPMALAASVVAAITLLDDDSVATVLILGLISTGIAGVLAFHPAVSDAFVNGSSYGDERRFLLTTPGAIMAGPIQLVWAAIAFGSTVGPILLLAERWILGGIALVIGWPLAYLALPVLHRLSNRWLVFVPAGMVVQDKTALREPQLFRKTGITALGPAPIDSPHEDLTLNSTGLALRVELIEPSKIVKNQRGGETELTDIGGFLVRPNRPGKVISAANERGFQIG